ncbi:MAG: PH domain-containing protein [Candidatus Izemoplasmatales bacterium]
MNNKYHIAKRKFIYDIIAAVGSSFVIAVLSISVLYDKGEEEILELTNSQSIVILLIFITALMVQLILRWMIMRRLLFSDQGKTFLIEKGLFFKRRINIPYSNIHSISLKRRFRDIILGLSLVQFDTGTTASVTPEAHIVVDKNYAPVLKDFVEQKKKNIDIILPSPTEFNKMENTEKNYLYNLKWHQVFFMGVLKPGFLIFILTFTVLMFGFVSVILQSDSDIVMTSTYPILIVIYFCGIILGALTFMIFSLFKFYNYRLSINESDITYQYGLLNRVEFKISKNRINAIHINQSLLYRLFGYFELNVSVLGVGNSLSSEENKIESKALLPMGKTDILNTIFNQLNSNKLDEVLPTKPKSFKYLNFIILPISFLIIINLFFYILLQINLIEYIVPILTNLVVILVAVFGLILRLKNHNFKVENNMVMFQRGAYTIRQSYIKSNRIQMIAYKQNPILLLEKIGNIQINYKDLGGVLYMKSYELNDFMKINNLLFKN